MEHPATARAAAPTELPANPSEAPAADSPPGVADKLVVVLFLIGVGLFGLISVVEMIGNLIR
jgi:hypothetical protein